ncbi:ATP-binding protein, partial [Staphylococcus pseudintermedius]|uniref:ATP-binding protein n=1 Tax=Staphylococcus pseudintermedius TaxID=283734 RepID=UPI002B47EE9A
MIQHRFFNELEGIMSQLHLAISLGVEACKQNIKTRYYIFKELIERLTTSEEKGIINKTLK